MKRCLVADQSETIRKVARHYLEQLSFEVLEADSADPALAMCRDKTVDAVILDARLPGKTTIEFLSALRFSGHGHRPLIIYATCENDPADISRAFAAGADTYMMKPFDQSAFLETISNAGLSG
jgi:two-component system chemotaxis response regulator CheY